MGLFTKLRNWLMESTGTDTNLNSVPTYERLSAEIIDKTDDSDLDTLVFNQIMSHVEKSNKTFNQKVIEFGELYINCTILSDAALMNEMDFELEIAENFEFLPYFPSAFEAVSCPSLKKLFEELNDYIKKEYNGILPFDLTDDESMESREYSDFESKMKPFAKAFREIIKSERIDLFKKEIDYIRDNKHKFI